MLMLRGMSLLAAASAAAVLLPSSAKAAATISFVESGGVVTATLSGNISNASATPMSVSNFGPGTQPASAYVSFTPSGGFPGGPVFLFDVNGPTDFGSGTFIPASTSSGDTLGFFGGFSDFFLDGSYVQGSALNATDTFAGQTFASMGLSPGTYVYDVLGPQGAISDTLTVIIGSGGSGGIGGVPEPATWAMMLLGFAAIGFVVRKRKTMQGQLV